MELDINFMQSVLGMYDVLINNGISVVYIGRFNHLTTKMFSNMFEAHMEESLETKSTKRVVYHTIVEILQNMQKHSDLMSEQYRLGQGLFMIGKTDDLYYIITSNKVTKKDMVDITLAIDLVNNCSKDQLKDMYKRQLKDGKISKRGGAGLGLIDIARKTGEKLDYLFLPIDETTDYFIFKVEINTKKINDQASID